MRAPQIHIRHGPIARLVILQQRVLSLYAGRRKPTGFRGAHPQYFYNHESLYTRKRLRLRLFCLWRPAMNARYPQLLIPRAPAAAETAKSPDSDRGFFLCGDFETAWDTAESIKKDGA